jgi:hypothetical protein
MRHVILLNLLLKLFLNLLLKLFLNMLGIKTMISPILDHVATAYLYLGINTGVEVMILFLVIVLGLSQD